MKAILGFQGGTELPGRVAASWCVSPMYPPILFWYYVFLRYSRILKNPFFQFHEDSAYTVIFFETFWITKFGVSLFVSSCLLNILWEGPSQPVKTKGMKIIQNPIPAFLLIYTL